MTHIHLAADTELNVPTRRHKCGNFSVPVEPAYDEMLRGKTLGSFGQKEEEEEDEQLNVVVVFPMQHTHALTVFQVCCMYFSVKQNPA